MVIFNVFNMVSVFMHACTVYWNVDRLTHWLAIWVIDKILNLDQIGSSQTYGWANVFNCTGHVKIVSSNELTNILLWTKKKKECQWWIKGS